ncbi:MAG: LysR family transcriptional regulator substrate-binding protein [Galactobacillus timonensis]|uniref:LysR family transcriptional regulator substrate-binding protein n=1 Tax=Galactobacillus timonensis TaxID=2041840 RepID=UPI0023F2349C|nr:LysR family transcriptional regulator substrate-binding protein [Galactobacillus timonensis]MDD7087084.1 LysR family transcriptional regulator substrate-binding protein [Galactobacillus timonensis]
MYEMAHPEMEFSFHMDGSLNLVEMLKDNQLDFIFVSDNFEKDDNNQIQAHLWDERELMAVMNAHHRLAGRSSVSFEDFDNENVLQTGPNTFGYHQMEQLVEHSHANMKIIGSSSQETVIVDLAKSGLTTGFLSRIAFSHTQEDGITAVPLKPPIPTRIYLVCRSDASKMITQAVADLSLRITLEFQKKRGLRNEFDAGKPCQNQ